MKIFDIRDQYTDIYELNDNAVQQASTHLWRNEIKKQILQTDESKVLLMHESCFEWHHMTVRLSQSDVLTWSQYKQIISEKLQQVQDDFWVKPLQITYCIKNIWVNRVSSQHVIWEAGQIVFDICCFVLKTERSDIVHLKNIRRYPRWYFMLYHPILSKKEKIWLLTIDKSQSTLMHLENWRYKKIATLNGWDDLLRQAYEQTWLDPKTSNYQRFDDNSIWSKLLSQAHADYNQVVLWWVKSHLDAGQDMMLISRLIDQPFYVESISKDFVDTFRSRLIPYRATELMHLHGKKRSIDQIPVLMLLKKIQEKKKS